MCSQLGGNGTVVGRGGGGGRCVRCGCGFTLHCGGWHARWGGGRPLLLVWSRLCRFPLQWTSWRAPQRRPMRRLTRGLFLFFVHNLVDGCGIMRRHDVAARRTCHVRWKIGAGGGSSPRRPIAATRAVWKGATDGGGDLGTGVRRHADADADTRSGHAHSRGSPPHEQWGGVCVSRAGGVGGVAQREQ